MTYELGYGASFELRKAYMAHGLTDVELLEAIVRLEQFEGTAEDIANLCHLAELAHLPWRELFPDVIPERNDSPALPPSSEANEERDGDVASPTPAPSRSVCTEVA